MQIREKALYNLLRFNWLKDPSLEVVVCRVEVYCLSEKSDLLIGLRDL